jgi:hypothetical protein
MEKGVNRTQNGLIMCKEWKSVVVPKCTLNDQLYMIKYSKT